MHLLQGVWKRDGEVIYYVHMWHASSFLVIRLYTIANYASRALIMRKILRSKDAQWKAE